MNDERTAADLARDLFRTTFGGEPDAIGRAPGRVELLGNHTDHNGGLVLAAAVDRVTVVAGRRAPGRSARLASASFDEVETFDLDAIGPGEPGHWGRYARGVAWALAERAGTPFASGFEAAVVGDVPLGAGLSSSASLQAALAAFLLGSELLPGFGLPDDDAARMDLAKTLQRSENAFVGVASGLLDQFSVLFGREGHALALDCRSLAFERVPLENASIVICDSKTSRRLADGMYNRRRDECERVVAHFQGRRADVTQLRDLSIEELEDQWNALDPVGRRRARHVLTENDRVRRGAEALKAGELAAFGALIGASHASSRDDFENSSPALDALIASAEAAPGFLGGKLSGAGWAGCTVNLVAPSLAEEFAASVADSYEKRTGITPAIHICRAAEGATFGR